jgi:hypothetical protein
MNSSAPARPTGAHPETRLRAAPTTTTEKSPMKQTLEQRLWSKVDRQAVAVETPQPAPGEQLPLFEDGTAA